VVVVEQDVLLSQERFRALLLEQSISVLWMTAGLFHQYAQGLMTVFGQLRYLIVGGDVLDPAVISRVLQEGTPAHLLNGQYAQGLMTVFGQLRYLIVGGDVLDPAVISRVLQEGTPAHLLNGYGPTEATTFTTTHEIKAVGEGSIPIGRPIGNTRVYVLDA
ncbi:AMP-binding protein, partial [Pseudomonas sp. JL3]|uniref:AMP-binding protein n=1 Tax=Pseudomonas sp. JL3 TaxID=2919943 RepID=UPI00285FCCC5